MADEATRRVVAALPLLKTNAGPRDRELWIQRLKEEYQALIKVRTLSTERQGKLYSGGYRGFFQRFALATVAPEGQTKPGRRNVSVPFPLVMPLNTIVGKMVKGDSSLKLKSWICKS